MYKRISLLYNILNIDYIRTAYMIFLVLLGLTFFIQMLASVWFVMVETGKGRRSALRYKLLCSLIYIADLLLCAAIADAHAHPYFVLVACGMLLSLAGDVISSIKENRCDTPLFITHSLSNAVYLSAFIWALHSIFNVAPKSMALILIAIPASLLLIPFMCRRNGKLSPVLILSVLSSVLMLSAALYLGMLCQSTEFPAMQSVSCALILGALAVSFSRLLHTRQQISPPPALKPQLPKYCAYFFGQMAIACSIIICGGLK